jgi:hypothetical protein
MAAVFWTAALSVTKMPGSSRAATKPRLFASLLRAYDSILLRASSLRRPGGRRLFTRRVSKFPGCGYLNHLDSTGYVWPFDCTLRMRQGEGKSRIPSGIEGWAGFLPLAFSAESGSPQSDPVRLLPITSTLNFVSTTWPTEIVNPYQAYDSEVTWESGTRRIGRSRWKLWLGRKDSNLHRLH